jgi:hypothetical protein
MKTKMILGALTAVTLLAGVAAPQPAEAGWWHYQWHYQWHSHSSNWHYHWHYHWWRR